MSRAAALRCFDEAEQGAATSHISLRRRPKLYLASCRRADGSVVTYDPLKQIVEVKDDKHIRPVYRKQPALPW